MLQPIKEDLKKFQEIMHSEKAKSLYPLDIALDIDALPFLMSPNMMLTVAKVAAEAKSYKNAAKHIYEYFGVKISVDTVHSVTDFVGAAVYADDERRARGALFRNGSMKWDLRRLRHSKQDILYGACDGSMGRVWCEDAPGTEWIEFKIGQFFHDKDIEESKPNKNGEIRRHITKKRLIGVVGNSVMFKRHFLALAEEYDYQHSHRIVILSDGAAWIHKMVKECFPYAIHILDLFHVKENVGKFGKWLIKDPLNASTWITIVYEMIENSEIDEVLDLLEPYKDTKTPEDIPNLYTYISNHRKMMDYKRYTERGYFVGSGTAESANKYVMQNRMKLPGQRWNRQQAQHMLCLKSRLEGDHWDEVGPILREYIKVHHALGLKAFEPCGLE